MLNPHIPTMEEIVEMVHSIPTTDVWISESICTMHYTDSMPEHAMFEVLITTVYVCPPNFPVYYISTSISTRYI